MIPVPAISLKTAIYAVTGIAFALLLAWALRLDHLRGEWKAKFEALTEQAGEVVLALEHATEQEQKWETAPGQIVALGESNRSFKVSMAESNLRIDELAREAVRLQARSAELKRIADKAEAQRQSALRRLSDMAATPGTRSDCMTLLREADTALDLVREAGA